LVWSRRYESIDDGDAQLPVLATVNIRWFSISRGCITPITTIFSIAIARLLMVADDLEKLEAPLPAEREEPSSDDD
jgi:hypothetical protein